MNAAPLGLRVLDAPWGARELVDHARALAAYHAADPGIDPRRVAFLSGFAYPAALAAHREAKAGAARAAGAPDPRKGWSAGYAGPVGAARLNFDIDRPGDPDAALADARRLCRRLGDRYGDAAVACYHSGSKGFHVVLSAGGLVPPAVGAHAVARRLAAGLAADAGGVTLDPSIYNPVALFRAPNSRHPATGRHKIAVPLADLPDVPFAEVAARAAGPVPGDVPPVVDSEAFAADWDEAADAEAEAAAAERPARGADPGKLNPTTWRLLDDPVSIVNGERHAVLFSAAADMIGRHPDAEDLVRVLLTRRGAETGLPPAEVARQIECGLRRGRGG